MNFSNLNSYLNSYCSNLFDMRNLQEQVKKSFCYQKLFPHFTVWINCSSDLKKFSNSRPSASNFYFFFIFITTFLTVCQNDFCIIITFLLKLQFLISSGNQMLYGSHRWKWKQYNSTIDWSLLWRRSDAMFESSSQCCRR